APDGAEKADVRARIADRREKGEVALEPVHLPELRDVHRPARAFDDLLGRQPAFLPQPPKLAKARLEDASHALRRLRGGHFPVERGQIAAGPEAVLELVRAAHRLLQ